MPKGARTTRRKQLEQVERSTKRKLPELESSRKWDGSLRYVWHWFNELSFSAPLTYSELYHWTILTKRELTPFEVDLLMELNRIRKEVEHG